MKPIVLTLVFAVTGWFFGNSIVRIATGVRTTRDANPSSTAIKSPRQRTSPTTPADNPHNLEFLLRANRRLHSGGMEATAQIERLHTADIRDLMVALSAAPRDSPSTWSPGRDRFLTAAADALFLRDGEKALHWADALDADSDRQSLLYHLIISAVAESPDLAKPWMDRFKAEFGEAKNDLLVRAAVAGATARGAAELVRLQATFGDEITEEGPNGPLSPDYDFPLLLKHFRCGNLATRYAIQHWAASDRDAAWRGIQELMGSDRSDVVASLGPLYSGAAIAAGEKSAARWIASKIDEMPQEFRHQALWDLLREGDCQSAAISTILAEFPRESDRLTLVSGMLNDGERDSQSHAAGLRALDSEPLQVRILSQFAANEAGDSQNTGDGLKSQLVIDYYTAIMDQLHLSPASRQQITQLLGANH